MASERCGTAERGQVLLCSLNCTHLHGAPTGLLGLRTSVQQDAAAQETAVCMQAPRSRICRSRSSGRCCNGDAPLHGVLSKTGRRITCRPAAGCHRRDPALVSKCRPRECGGHDGRSFRLFASDCHGILCARDTRLNADGSSVFHRQ